MRKKTGWAYLVPDPMRGWIYALVVADLSDVLKVRSVSNHRVQQQRSKSLLSGAPCVYLNWDTIQGPGLIHSANSILHQPGGFQRRGGMKIVCPQICVGLSNIEDATVPSTCDILLSTKRARSFVAQEALRSPRQIQTHFAALRGKDRRAAGYWRRCEEGDKLLLGSGIFLKN